MLISPIEAIELFKKKNTYCILIGNNEELIIILSKYIQNLFDTTIDHKPNQISLFDEKILIKNTKILPYDENHSYLIIQKYLSPQDKKKLNQNIIYVNCYEDNYNLKLLQIAKLKNISHLNITEDKINNILQLNHLAIESESLQFIHKEQSRSLYNIIYQFLQDNRIEFYFLENPNANKMFILYGIKNLIKKKLGDKVNIHFKDEKIFNLLCKKYNIINFINLLAILNKI